MPQNKRRRAEEMDSLIRDTEAMREQRLGSWPSLRCGKSMAFRNERRHLVMLSVLAGVVFFGCGLLGGTTSSRYIAPSSPSRGSFSASSTPVEQSGLDGGAMAAGEQQQAKLAAEVDSSGETTTTELKVRMFNTYTLQNPITLYPWEHMAEPYKPSTMELLGWPVSGEHLEYR
ncbi:unnamed protein product [Ectocarpus sp. CCAP 1310/34]|nr:unnamed protein product [Ectocarpus sp. CCAP 1310/34]